MNVGVFPFTPFRPVEAHRGRWNPEADADLERELRDRVAREARTTSNATEGADGRG